MYQIVENKKGKRRQVECGAMVAEIRKFGRIIQHILAKNPKFQRYCMTDRVTVKTHCTILLVRNY